MKLIKIISLLALFSNYCGYADSGANMMPNPGAEQVIAAKDYFDETASAKIKIAPIVPVDGWSKVISSGVCSWGATDVAAHSGKYSCFRRVEELNTNGVTEFCIILGGKTNGKNSEYALAAKPDTTYYFSFWIKGKDTSHIQIKWLEWEQGNHNPKERRSSFGHTYIAVTDQWVKYEGILNTMKNTDKFVVCLYIANTVCPKINDLIYVDDVEIALYE